MKSRCLPVLVWAGALLAFAQPNISEAQQGGGLELDWEAPPGCPSREVVRERVRALVGASLDEASRLRAEGRIERSNGRYRLTLTVREDSTSTERVIESSSCSDLGGAAAVALGLLVRSEFDARRGLGDGAQANDSVPPASPDDSPTSSDASPAPEAKTATNPDANERRPPAPLPSTRSSASWRFLFRGPLVGLDLGPLPRPAPTFGLAAGTGVEGFELTLGARLSLDQTAWVNDAPPYGAELSRATAELRSCYEFRWRRLGAAPCLLFALDLLTARGVGDEVNSRTRSTLVPAAGAGALGKFWLSDSVALVLSATAQVEASRTRIALDGLGDVARVTPFVLSVSTGVEWSP